MAERVGSNILEVDPDQDLTDVVHRLREFPGDGAVIIPAGAPRFQTDESLQVLKRQAVSSGRRIAVITADADIQKRARGAGLAAFVDRAAYEASIVPPPPVAAAPPSLRRRTRVRVNGRLAALAGGLALIALAAAAAVFPTATVTLSVAGSEVKIDAPLSGFPGSDTAYLSFDTRTLKAEASDTQNAPATGQREVPAIAASGEVVFTAISCDSPIQLPAGTVVETAARKQYATKGSISLCTPSASATALVFALAAGNASNVPAYSLTAVDTMPSIAVTNPGPLSGGADPRTAMVVQQSDVDALRTQLLASVDVAARKQLEAEASALHVIASSSPEYSAQIDPPVGSESTTVSVMVTETLKGVAYSDRDVGARLRDELTARVPSGFALTGDPIRTWYEVTAATEDGHVTLSGHGLAYAMPVFDAAAITRGITGHSLGSARDLLGKLPDVVRVDIRQRPFPLPWLPMQVSHVSIQVFESSPGKT